jgi:histidinol dehydrogenase
MRKGLGIKVWDSKELSVDWFKREKADKQATVELENNVKFIMAQVKQNGDKALVEFALKFDKAELTTRTLRVKPEEIKEAYTKTSSQQVSAIKFMKEKVGDFQKHLVNKTDIKTVSDGISVQTVLRPIKSVGCYVPGGQAAYPSTLVMTAVPAKIAGVPRIVVCSPSDARGRVNPLVLVASDICGVDEVYKVGGAQAIAALAYGTKAIEPVYKIVGPGSKYVTSAKVFVSNDVAIDMPAGPSEVLILADESADARFIAYDMVSQAEHGDDSVAGLITTSEMVALQVQENLKTIVALAQRREKISASLAKYGFIIVCSDIKEMVALANQFAPEHLEVLTAKPNEIADQLTAGLILLGPYSPVALSDYGSGTNHVLPTGGFAQSYSGLTVLDFMRRVSIVETTRTGLERVKDSIKTLTEAENLPNHYKAITARFEK